VIRPMQAQLVQLLAAAVGETDINSRLDALPAETLD